MLSQEFDEATCLCQGKVPKEERIDIIQWVIDPKTERGLWKPVLRYHKHCPHHGVKVIEDAPRPQPE